MRKLTQHRSPVRGLGFTGKQLSEIAKWSMVGLGAGSAYLGYKDLSDPNTSVIERAVATVVGLGGAALVASLLFDLKKLF